MTIKRKEIPDDPHPHSWHGLLVPLTATAQDLPTAPYLPLELAIEAANAALKACAAEGYNVSVAIIARDGSAKVLLKADRKRS